MAPLQRESHVARTRFEQGSIEKSSPPLVQEYIEPLRAENEAKEKPQ